MAADMGLEKMGWNLTFQDFRDGELTVLVIHEDEGTDSDSQVSGLSA